MMSRRLPITAGKYVRDERPGDRTLPRTIVVLPWNIERIVANQDSAHGFASQAETSMGPISEPMSVEERITALRETCLRKTEPLENRHSILIFDGREHTQRLEIDAQSQLPPSLPDCWLYTTMDFLDITDKATAEDAKDALVQKAAEHADKKSTLDREAARRQIEANHGFARSLQPPLPRTLLCECERSARGTSARRNVPGRGPAVSRI